MPLPPSPPPAPAPQPLRVGFVLMEDFTMLALAGFLDTLRLAADEAGLSVRQLERRFAAETGGTPTSFRHRLRLLRADELLRGGALPMTEIALACGFADAAHFSREYRRHRGLAPSAARRAARGRA